jgi:hypothetical protein
MNFWLFVGAAFVVYVLYLCFGQGGWSTKSKHFKLYKVLIDPNKAPDFSVTILKGDFPQQTVTGFLTYILPRVATKRGLKSHEIVGCLKNFKGEFIPENFSGNKAFKDMIHSIAAKEIPEFVRTKAKMLGTGKIKLMDDRIASHQADASDEHCIGLYSVDNGVVVAYAPNPSFQLFSNQGPLELVESIRTVLYSETERTSGQTQAA